MSSHHSAKFFVTHYGQMQRSKQRKELRQQIRELQREENAIKWAEYRYNMRRMYLSVTAFYISFLLAAGSLAIYAIRNMT